ncbi:hypothetical protein N7535_008705 [Penicillium sp. DV-2018c]|nr:hypothetical protein N7535_008705 [Penicillium sp. DV-2018c]
MTSPGGLGALYRALLLHHQLTIHSHCSLLAEFHLFLLCNTILFSSVWIFLCYAPSTFPDLVPSNY